MYGRYLQKGLRMITPLMLKAQKQDPNLLMNKRRYYASRILKF